MLRLPQFTFCFLLLLLPLITCSNSKPTTVYDVLRAHGLPMGLLPKGVVDFEVDDAGRFTAHLDQACNAKFESELHYDRNVSGRLSFGRIGSLSGILAQELFLWFPVKGIRIDVPSSGIIYFDVGVVYKQFSLSLFETPPDCTAASGSFEAIGTVSKSKSVKLRSKLNYELVNSIRNQRLEEAELKHTQFVVSQLQEDRVRQAEETM